MFSILFYSILFYSRQGEIKRANRRLLMAEISLDAATNNRHQQQQQQHAILSVNELCLEG